MNFCRSHFAGLILAAMFSSPALANQHVSLPLLQALEAMRMGKATIAQTALLFQNNDVINQARLNGWITDNHYQAAQKDFASRNAEFAKRAATEAGADFTPQKSKSTSYSPGTDSDFIATVKGNDPVGQIADMQARYNRNVNDFLKNSLESDGMHFQSRSDWHNRLDVDFMADPRHVTDLQFQKIADLNNDAYRRRQAAEFERISRAGDGSKVTPDQFRDYAAEMRDFIGKKQQKMEKYRRHPELLSDPGEMAQYHRLMAQEQKYIERVEASEDLLRRQERLKNSKESIKDPYYELSHDANGNARIRKRSSETIAARGAQRSPSNRETTFAASSVADNSTNRAFRQLAESMAIAHGKNPQGWANAAKDIAEITDHLPPAEKGLLIEQLRQHRGREFAGEVAEAMRQRSKTNLSASQLSKLNDSLQSALGISHDLAEMGALRRGFNQTAGQVLGGLDKLGTLGTLAELASAASDARSYWQNLQRALDPSISDAEADEYFELAQEASENLALAGGMGVLFEAVPVLGAAYGGWTLGYDGTRWILNNTETGQAIDRHVTDYFDRHLQAFENTTDRLTEYFGGESSRMADEDRLRGLESSYLRAIREGRIKLKPGVKSLEILQRLRAGDVWGLDELLEPNAAPQTLDTDSKGYMAWTNDVKWIHAGTIESYQRPQTRGSELWGGRSNDPLPKSPYLGGRTFDTMDGVIAALASDLGSTVVMKRAPLASPKVYYQAGDLMVGFEIMRHPLFQEIKAAADAKNR